MTILFVKGEMRSRWIFRNMLASLKHLGIASFDGKIGMSGRGVFCLLVKAMLVIWLARCSLVLACNIGKGQTIKRGMDLINIIGCLVFHWKFSQHQEAISELLDTMDGLRHDTVSGNRLAKITKYSILVMWVFESIRIPSDYATFIFEKRYNLFIARDLLLKPEDFSESAAPVVHGIAIFVFFIERVLVSGTVSSVVLFLSIYKFNQYDFLMDEMLKADSMKQATEMMKLRLIHADLCLLVEKIDDIFSTVVFVLHLLATLQLCIEVDKLLAAWSASRLSALTFFGLYSYGSHEMLDASY
ncbi:uncharacterized protein LOC111269197 [Varroa jacobsoni]|uniref:uncharacterized protein LOC111269197 n=1 Tax=Varroa jacobsoni TaxID=62625 RepID=UPI000BF7D873|nr:uncharacterized protein LOC111269197 [Varroa jacobsoni]